MVGGEGLDALHDTHAEFGVLDALSHGIIAADGHRIAEGYTAVGRLPHTDAAHAVGRGARGLDERRVGTPLRAGVAGCRSPGETPCGAGFAVGGATAEIAAAGVAARPAAARAGIVPARSLLFLLETVVEAAAQFVDGRRCGSVGRAVRAVVVGAGTEVGPDIFRVDLAQEATRARELHVAPLETHLGVGDRRLDLGTGERHVEQAPLLLHAVGRLGGPLRGEEVFLQPDDIHVFVFQPLGRVDGHQRHLVAVFGVVLVHVGHQHDVLQPLLDGRLFVLRTLPVADFGVAPLLELLHRVQQLLDIVQCRGRLGGILGTVGREDTRAGGDLEPEVVKPLLVAGERQRADHRHEVRHLAGDGLLHGIGGRLGDQRVDRLPHRDAPLGGQLRDALHGRVADAARRIVDDAFERLVVARVDHQPDIGQHVLDLLVVVERTALVDAVGNAAAAEVVLQHGRLVVGAVEDHRFRPVVARRANFVAQIGDHHFGLLAVGIGLENADRFTHVAGRETVFLHAPGVADDDRVGRIDDRAGRAVVLLELEDLGRGKILLEGEDVLDLGTAERVDRLCVVAHHADLGVELRQAADDDVLGVVGVLVLVHQDVFEQLLVARQHVRGVAQQDVGLQKQVVEVHRTVALAALAVDIVDIAELGDLRLPVFGGIDRVGEVGAGRHQAVLGVGDTRGDEVGLVFLVREVQFADDGLDEVLAVRGLVDRKRLGETDLFGVLAQDARKDRVERTHADIAAAVIGDHLRDALAHLLGGLVGEGERQDVEGRHALLDHIGDARGQHARFARTGAGDDERRGVVIDHGIALCGVQALQYRRFFGFHGCKVNTFSQALRQSPADFGIKFTRKAPHADSGAQQSKADCRPAAILSGHPKTQPTTGTEIPVSARMVRVTG